MVSPLWIAADSGDVDQVRILLKDPSSVDIEIKDEAGATPLVQAVKNGHGDIVKALLDAGADPTVSSNHGSIEQLTTDATILELLSAARDKKPQPETETTGGSPAPGSAPEQPEQTFAQPAPEGFQQNYTAYGQVPPPPGPYMYYPAPYPGAMLPDGSPAPYYPPPPPPNGTAQSTQPSDAMGNGSLPPPEIARLIPCRYFPACRYGPSCIFAHPQGPYFQGPLPPPAHYSAHYDPMAHPPYAGYYGVQPQSPYSQPPSSALPASSPQNPSHSPVSQPQHVRSGSEATSPTQPPYNSTSAPAPPPMPYGIPLPGGYPVPGQMHVPPMHLGMPPTQQPIPQPNGYMYSPTSPVVQSSAHRNEMNLPNGIAQYPQVEGNAPNGAQPMQPPSQQDAYANASRPQVPNNLRRGSVRRMSGAGSTNRKPPCAFFPSGRCRNGDSCKFPHILPEAGELPQGNYVTKFGGRARAQTQPQGDLLSEKLAGLNLKSDGSPNGSQVNGQGQRSNGPKANGVRHEKRGGANGRTAQQTSQRVPSADEFPVLGGSVTPPSRSPVANPVNGPTAAEVLKAPAPPSIKSERTSTDGTNTPSGSSETGSIVKDPDEPTNGHTNGVNTDMDACAPEIKPLSFAAVATGGAASPPEPGSTVTVSVSA